MRSFNQSWIVLFGACLAAAWLGCQNGGSGQGSGGSNGGGRGKSEGATNQGSAKGSSSRGPSEPATPPPATIPQVKLLQKDRDKCRVFVGDVMPEAELPDLTGAPHPLQSLYGQKLTVIHFWRSGELPYGPLFAEDALNFLAKDIAEKFAEKGVRVVGINEGDPAQVAGQRIANAEAAVRTFSHLTDADGDYFASVAKEKLPRTYLLDAWGKILWFDMEFSQITRDELRQAIQVALGET